MLHLFFYCWVCEFTGVSSCGWVSSLSGWKVVMWSLFFHVMFMDSSTPHLNKAAVSFLLVSHLGRTVSSQVVKWLGLRDYVPPDPLDDAKLVSQNNVVPLTGVSVFVALSPLSHLESSGFSFFLWSPFLNEQWGSWSLESSGWIAYLHLFLFCCWVPFSYCVLELFYEFKMCSLHRMMWWCPRG
jgi:hypothetical protein